MILDYNARLCDAQAFTATARSTNTYNLGSDRDVGAGEPLAVLITVVAAADNTTGNETYSFALQTDDNSSSSSAETIMTITPSATQLTVGSQWVLPIPHANEQFLSVLATLGGTTPSITIDADIVMMSEIPKLAYYPSGFTVA